MPHNFKLIGDYYVSKAGSDSNNGLTPDTPKRTIQGVISAITISSGQTKNIIIGAGVYNESFSLSAGSAFFHVINFFADGIVIFDSPSSIGSISLNVGNGYGGGTAFIYFYNFIFRGYSSISFTHIWNTQAIVLSNCNIINSNISISGNPSSSGNQQFQNCQFINTNLQVQTGANPSTFIINYCIFINSKILSQTTTGWRTITNSYFNSASILTIPSVVTLFNFNNIQCPILMYFATAVTDGVYQDVYGRYYDLSITTSTGDGTIGNPFGRPYTNGAAFNLTNNKILYPSYNTNSIASEPKFNNIKKKDFSLQIDSPNVRKASNYVDNIGGTYVAERLDASGSFFSGSNVIVESLIKSTFSDYMISGSELSGSVTSLPIFISSSAKVLQEIDYNGLLYFNKDTSSLFINQNVPDVLTYTSASLDYGANPDRLSYYMRWTTASSQPITDLDWDNGGIYPKGIFNIFEWNTKPSLDNFGRGNGSKDYIGINTPTYIEATWIQLKITIRNNYLI